MVCGITHDQNSVLWENWEILYSFAVLYLDIMKDIWYCNKNRFSIWRPFWCKKLPKIPWWTNCNVSYQFTWRLLECFNTNLSVTMVRDVHWYSIHKTQDKLVSVCLLYEETFENKWHIEIVPCPNFVTCVTDICSIILLNVFQRISPTVLMRKGGETSTHKKNFAIHVKKTKVSTTSIWNENVT